MHLGGVLSGLFPSCPVHTLGHLACVWALLLVFGCLGALGAVLGDIDIFAISVSGALGTCRRDIARFASSPGSTPISNSGGFEAVEAHDDRSGGFGGPTRVGGRRCAGIGRVGADINDSIDVNDRARPEAPTMC